MLSMMTTAWSERPMPAQLLGNLNLSMLTLGHPLGEQVPTTMIGAAAGFCGKSDREEMRDVALP